MKEEKRRDTPVIEIYWFLRHTGNGTIIQQNLFLKVYLFKLACGSECRKDNVIVLCEIVLLTNSKLSDHQKKNRKEMEGKSVT